MKPAAIVAAWVILAVVPAAMGAGTADFTCRVIYESSGEQARKAALYLLAAASIALNVILLWRFAKQRGA